jgi:hypothetical protein
LKLRQRIKKADLWVGFFVWAGVISHGFPGLRLPGSE